MVSGVRRDILEAEEAHRLCRDGEASFHGLDTVHRGEDALLEIKGIPSREVAARLADDSGTACGSEIACVDTA